MQSEDVEVRFEGRRIYVQVKHRKQPLAWSDIHEALARFGELRAAHGRGEALPFDMGHVRHPTLYDAPSDKANDLPPL